MLIAGKLKAYQERLEDLDSKILDIMDADDDDALEAEIQTTSKYLSDILEAKGSIEIWLTHLDSANVAASLKSSENVQSTEPGHVKAARLPKLEISPYEGDPLRWQEFWDIFRTAVDEREDLKPVEKLTYLKSYLKGETLQVVAGYRITAENYEVITETLKEKFGDPEVAIHAHMEKFLAVSVDYSDPGALQRIYYECERLS